MMDLYNTTTFECSKLITEHYSTSFTLGIKTLDKRFHFPVYGIYGFVRYADEIVDTFHGYEKKTLLADFTADTYRAIEAGISLNPVLHSFQIVVNKYKIERYIILMAVIIILITFFSVKYISNRTMDTNRLESVKYRILLKLSKGTTKRNYLKFDSSANTFTLPELEEQLEKIEGK